MTKINDTLKAVYAWFQAKMNERKWSKLISQAMADVPQEKQSFVRTCLNNQRQYMQVIPEASTVSVALELTKFVAVRLHHLERIVGVQPFTGPVGLVYRLVGTDTPLIKQGSSA